MDRVQIAAEKVSWHMEQIAKLFQPGIKISVAVRTPGEPERDFFMTSEEKLDDLVDMVKRRQAAGRDR